MGTRSLVHFEKEDGAILCTVYRQFDGYPEGRGRELAEFLATVLLVNGFGREPNEGELLANGMSDLAAHWVMHEKSVDGQRGNVYIYPPGCSGVWEDYTYTVYPFENHPRIKCADFDSFDGTPAEFLAALSKSAA